MTSAVVPAASVEVGVVRMSVMSARVQLVNASGRLARTISGDGASASAGAGLSLAASVLAGAGLSPEAGAGAVSDVLSPQDGARVQKDNASAAEVMSRVFICNERNEGGGTPGFWCVRVCSSKERMSSTMTDKS